MAPALRVPTHDEWAGRGGKVDQEPGTGDREEVRVALPEEAPWPCSWILQG